MSVRFVRLRIQGFKSFAEPTDIELAADLTGLIGPNGCGKSNIVEALRWTMGENSAKSLRGDGMDDVIFSGTSSRPARNLVEVSLLLDGATGLLSPPFDKAQELLVTRRLERGQRSEYRINGRVYRARDIQTFFADIGSGARSQSVISQGRVSGLIEASPDDRSSVLHEAAGISGLYNRRHEAELKLKATEDNQKRAEDLQSQLQQQISRMREQMEQADLYRDISARLRIAQGELVSIMYTRLSQQVLAAHRQLDEKIELLDEVRKELEEHIHSEKTIEKSLPALREALNQAVVQLERSRIRAEEDISASQQIEQSLGQVRLRLQDTHKTLISAHTRLEEVQADIKQHTSNHQKILRIAEELPKKCSTNKQQLMRKKKELEHITEAYLVSDQTLQNLLALRHRHEAYLSSLQDRMNILQSEQVKINQNISRAESALPHCTDMRVLQMEVKKIRNQLSILQQQKSKLQKVQTETRLSAQQADAQFKEDSQNYNNYQKALTQKVKEWDRFVQAVKRCSDKLAHLRSRCVFLKREIQSFADIKQLADKLEQIAHECRQAEATRAEVFARAYKANALLDAIAMRRRQLNDQLVQLGRERAESCKFYYSLNQERHRISHEILSEKSLEDAKHYMQDIEQAYNKLVQKHQDILGQYNRLQQDHMEAENKVRIRRQTYLDLQAQIKGLRQILKFRNTDNKSYGPPIIQSFAVPAGLEMAFASVLGEGTMASTARDSALCWVRRNNDLKVPSLPHGVVPLITLGNFPDELWAILTFTGLVEGKLEAITCQVLQPGQILVDRQGNLARWDGFYASIERKSFDSQYIRQQAHLARLQIKVASCEQTMQREEIVWHKLSDKLSGSKQTLDRLESEKERVREEFYQTKNEYENRLQILQIAKLRHQSICRELVRYFRVWQVSTQRVNVVRNELSSFMDEKELAVQLSECRLAEKQVEARLVVLKKQLGKLLEEQRNFYQKQSRIRQKQQNVEHQVVLLEAEQIRCKDNLSQVDSALQNLRDKLSRFHDLEESKAAVHKMHHAAEKASAHYENHEKSIIVLHDKLVEKEKILTHLESEYDRLSLHIDWNRKQSTKVEKDVAECQKLIEQQRQVLVQFADYEKEKIRFQELTMQRDNLRQAVEHLEREQDTLEEEDRQIKESIPYQSELLDQWQGRLIRAEQDVEHQVKSIELGNKELTELLSRKTQLEGRYDQNKLAVQQASEYFDLLRSQLEEEEKIFQQCQSKRQGIQDKLQNTREHKVRAETRLEQITVVLDKFFDDHPDFVRKSSLVPLPDGNAEIHLRKKVEALRQQREELGAVNLRAVDEYRQLARQDEKMQSEQEELTKAVAQLRQTITNLNTEGRVLLAQNFEKINGHFQDLFTQMFDGGQANLGMVGNEDPLLAGLEITARPPGKKMAALSLMSGGEQALTALCLIFAIFLCNPAPLCVLDEVDAPLDEANVGRFCRLLREISTKTGTRFLIVTHHQLTMTNMDRLYGVTMQEKGVSRVLSMDMRTITGVTSESVH